MKDNYNDFLHYLNEIEKNDGTDQMPIVRMPIEVTNENIPTWPDLCQIAAEEFSKKVCLIANQSFILGEQSIEPLRYVFLEFTEIVQDENCDFCSLYFVSILDIRNKSELIFENMRTIFFHAITLAASYAIKYGTDHVVFEKHNRFGWA